MIWVSNLYLYEWLFQSAQLARRPIQMAICTTGSLSFIGDGLCQCIEYKYTESSNSKFKWEIQRSLRFGFVGMLLGPCLSIWYTTLGRMIPGDSLAVALKRMVLDQSLFAPTIIAGVFTLNTFIDGGDWNEAVNRIKEQLVPTYKVNLMVWPFTQLLNFWIIPPQYRVLMANAVSLWWNSYLSYRAHVNISDKESFDL